ncbi:hypothetical protein DH86_00003107 [Scytalidium sp. 3C]|nr:hypothetical protein DH86_00003107 [Scytalidium sp. 3C]
MLHHSYGTRINLCLRHPTKSTGQVSTPLTHRRPLHL